MLNELFDSADPAADCKTCPGCENQLPREQFHRDGSRRDGLDVYCVRCASMRYRGARATPDLSPERIASNARARRVLEDRRYLAQSDPLFS